MLVFGNKARYECSEEKPRSCDLSNISCLNTPNQREAHATDTGIEFESKEWFSDFEGTSIDLSSGANSDGNPTAGLRRRNILTKQTAAAIFNLRHIHSIFRLQSVRVSNLPPTHATTRWSVLVSRMFGISPKAVRDIWNQRTWRHVTQSLPWTPEVSPDDPTFGTGSQQDMLMDRFSAAVSTLRPIGRPRGSKDSQPRRPRAIGAKAAAHMPAPYKTNVLYHTQSQKQAPGESDAVCRCPVGGPPSALRSSASQPTCASGLAVDEEEPELRRTFPFFLQDPQWRP